MHMMMRMCRTTIDMNFAGHRFRQTPVYIELILYRPKMYIIKITIYLYRCDVFGTIAQRYFTKEIEHRILADK